jgi:hypothetical protein
VELDEKENIGMCEVDAAALVCLLDWLRYLMHNCVPSVTVDLR